MSRVYSDLVRVVRALTVHLGASPVEKCACDVTPNSSYVKLLGLRIYGFFCGAHDMMHAHVMQYLQVSAVKRVLVWKRFYLICWN